MTWRAPTFPEWNYMTWRALCISPWLEATMLVADKTHMFQITGGRAVQVETV